MLADGDEGNCTLANILQVLGNIVLSVILFRMIGIAGIGIGTLVGTGLSFLVWLILLGLGLSALRDVAVAAPLTVIGGFAFGIYGIMAGAAISPAVAYFLPLGYISWRYGRDNCPLLLNELERGQKYGFYEFTLTPEEIVDVQERANEMLRAYSVPEKIVLKMGVLIKDLFMLVRERNNDRKKEI